MLCAGVDGIVLVTWIGRCLRAMFLLWRQEENEKSDPPAEEISPWRTSVRGTQRHDSFADLHHASALSHVDCTNMMQMPTMITVEL